MDEFDKRIGGSINIDYVDWFDGEASNFIRDAKILQIFQAQSFSHQNPICLIQII